MSDERQNPKWRDLLAFIQEQVDKEGDSFLDNQLYIECVNPETMNPSFDSIKDSEDWVYVSPAWWRNPKDGKCVVMFSRWEDKKIVTININY